jgi:hypothetical protein
MRKESQTAALKSEIRIAVLYMYRALERGYLSAPFVTDAQSTLSQLDALPLVLR